MSAEIHPAEVVEYPDSDGKPMAENTLQYEWIVTLKGNIDAMFANDPNVFVAGDNLIYPRKGDPSEVKAPDVYVAFGRPKGHRGSYKVWNEADVFPQVIFEVLSPGNSKREMGRRREFYERYGAEEFYIIDPDYLAFEVWLRVGDRLVAQPRSAEFVSPKLGIRFVLNDDELAVFKPDGQRFLSFQETVDRAEQDRAQAEENRARAEENQARADRLAAKLRALGIDPDAV